MTTADTTAIACRYRAAEGRCISCYWCEWCKTHRCFRDGGPCKHVTTPLRNAQGGEYRGRRTTWAQW